MVDLVQHFLTFFYPRANPEIKMFIFQENFTKTHYSRVNHTHVPFTLVIRMPSLQTATKIIWPCRWLCQLTLVLDICRHHQMDGQLTTAQGTLSNLWRNPG